MHYVCINACVCLYTCVYIHMHICTDRQRYIHSHTAVVRQYVIWNLFIKMWVCYESSERFCTGSIFMVNTYAYFICSWQSMLSGLTLLNIMLKIPTWEVVLVMTYTPKISFGGLFCEHVLLLLSLVAYVVRYIILCALWLDKITATLEAKPRA